MDGQKDRYTEDEKIDRWILFFLDCMVTLIQRLERKYETYKKLEKELNGRQKKVLKFIQEVQTTAIGSIEKALGDYSRNTLKKDLAYLVDEGLILKTGELKGTRYHYIE